MKKMLFFWICSIALLLNHPCQVSAFTSPPDSLSENELRKYANENNTWVICYQQGSRNSDFYQFDATDTHLYFSYSEYSCVDVYDIQGTFLYSIIFPDRQNGSVNVRCEDNQAYICSKFDTLYIFEDIEEVERMDCDTAREKGFDFFWFYDNKPIITVDRNWISWYDESGEITKQIATPSAIRKTIPHSNPQIVILPIIVLAVVLPLLLYLIRSSILPKMSRKG